MFTISAVTHVDKSLNDMQVIADTQNHPNVILTIKDPQNLHSGALN